MAATSARLVGRYLQQLMSSDDSALPDHELVHRFVHCHDERAFAALVDRHAAMVLGLCRSILHNGHDAEDIFQAAFLVLARKATSLRKGESVGSYLYSIATRLARKARIRDDKRRRREQQAARHEAVPMDDLTWGELRGILHEEVSRLPEKLRAAVVLCYWQGRTHEEAARHLGCARDTIKDRLQRARQRLRTRLARRGLALSAAWVAATLSGEMSRAAVAAELVQTTVRGAMLFRAGRPALGLVSAHAIASAHSALGVLSLGKLEVVTLLALALGVLGGISWTVLPQAPAGVPVAQAAPPQQREEPPQVTQQTKRQENSEDPLPPGALARLGSLRFRHGDRIHDIELVPDGKTIVSAAGKTVHLWELATGKERKRLAFDVPVPCVACSPTGEFLAIGCEDGTIHLCDPASGRDIRRFEAHKGRAPAWVGPSGVGLMQISSDGRRLVSMGSDLTLRVWDTASGEQDHEIGPFRMVASLALSPNGKTLAGVVQEGDAWTIRLWQTATGKEDQRLPDLGGRPINVTFSPNGATLAVAVGADDWKKPSVIKLWDLAQRKEVRTLPGHKGWSGSLTFSPDGKTLASLSSVDISGRLWDVKTGAARPLGQDRRAPLFKVRFHPDGKTLVSYGQENTLRFWDAATGKEVRASDGAQSWIGAVSFSPDGRLLASGSADGLIQLWDPATRKEVRRFTHSGWLVGLPFSPDGRLLASAGMFDPVVRIWEARSGKEASHIEAPGMFITCLAWSGDGKTLATWSRVDRLIHLWDAATGKERHHLGPIAEWVNGVTFAPDGRTVAAGVAGHPVVVGGEGGKENLLLWSADTGKLLARLKEPAGVRCLVFSPDGRTLAAGGMDRAIHLWEVASGQKRLTLQHGEEITSLAYSPDGRVLAAVNNPTSTRLSSDGTTGTPEVGKPPPPRVRLWDVLAAKEMPSLPGHQGAITSLAFSPNGALLATASNDTTVLLWDAMRLRAPGRAGERLRPEQIDLLWSDLGGADPVKAYQAVRLLAAVPEQGVQLFQRRLKPVSPADGKQVARLLADLDSAEFAERERAMRELEKLGDRAASELQAALAANPPLEVKRRIERLLEKARGNGYLATVRALEVLEMANTKEAREMCATLAGGVAEAPRTRAARAALERMKRRAAAAP